jgi:hypothetical protein
MGKRFRLSIYPTDLERDRRNQSWRTRRIGQDVQERLADMPVSQADWRAVVLPLFESFSAGIEKFARGEYVGLSGYSLSQDGQNLAGIHLQALRILFETSPVLFDAEARRRGEREISEPLRQANPEAQAFVQRVVGGAV